MTIVDPRPPLVASHGAVPPSAPEARAAPTRKGPEAWLTSTPNGESELRPPTSVWYWARLDGLPKRPAPYALRAAFEAWLPLPVDDVEARFVCTGAGGWIACGVESATLTTWIESVTAEGGPALTSIRPAAWPDFIDDPPGESLLPEFRTGPFACPVLRRHRRRLTTVAALAVLTVAVATCLSLIGRAHALDRSAAAIAGQSQMVITGALDLDGPLPASVDPARLLAATLEALRNATDQTATAHRAPEAIGPYLTLLAVWPADLPTRVDQLEVNESSLRLTLSVRDHTDAERLVDVLDTPDLPWTLGSRNIQQSPRPEDGVRVSLLLKRIPRPEAKP